ncbi:MAG: SufS family cysteine desulfurase [Candidatus Buchananbacteria bacterium]|nr:SufS family cysteine desulfurase [Candidatus Buchananbacteria bacterium]
MKNLVNKNNFPIFSGRFKKMVYLDSAATSQKPKEVIAAEKDWYENHNANIHRGAYKLAEEATELFENSRQKVADFISAPSAKSIVFTKGATESINLVAGAWARYNLKKGDTILLTEMEHHANIVPWQLLSKERGFKIKYWPISQAGELIMSNLDELFSGVKFLSLVHISNVLGTVNQIEKIISLAKKKGLVVLVDAAQSVVHLPINVVKMKADFLVFSAHKMLGPTGLGVLYIQPDLFNQMKPYQSGGEMISEVGFKSVKFKKVPWLLEAGTQPLAQVFALNKTIDYINKVGLKNIKEHSRSLTDYAYLKLSEIDGLTIHGPSAKKRLGLISFSTKIIHAHDLATLLDRKNIFIRAGHHCAMPLHEKLNVPATARISFGIYNTKEDVDKFIKELKSILKQWSQPIKKQF